MSISIKVISEYTNSTDIGNTDQVKRLKHHPYFFYDFSGEFLGKPPFLKSCGNEREDFTIGKPKRHNSWIYSRKFSKKEKRNLNNNCFFIEGIIKALQYEEKQFAGDDSNEFMNTFNKKTE